MVHSVDEVDPLEEVDSLEEEDLLEGEDLQPVARLGHLRPFVEAVVSVVEVEEVPEVEVGEARRTFESETMTTRTRREVVVISTQSWIPTSDTLRTRCDLACEPSTHLP